jgi:hypothetical protein
VLARRCQLSWRPLPPIKFVSNATDKLAPREKNDSYCDESSKLHTWLGTKKQQEFCKDKKTMKPPVRVSGIAKRRKMFNRYASTLVLYRRFGLAR